MPIPKPIALSTNNPTKFVKVLAKNGHIKNLPRKPLAFD